jgi:hypothetical protein
MSTVDDPLDRARRRTELRFADPVPADVFDGVPGVAAAEVRDRTAPLTIDGPVGPAMRAGDEAAGGLELLLVNPLIATAALIAAGLPRLARRDLH